MLYLTFLKISHNFHSHIFIRLKLLVLSSIRSHSFLLITTSTFDYVGVNNELSIFNAN